MDQSSSCLKFLFKRNAFTFFFKIGILYFLVRNFIFKNFINSQNFINKVGEISENENHHPDISFGWGYAKIIITTHAIEGLSENDFILAAKIDQVFNV